MLAAAATRGALRCARLLTMSTGTCSRQASSAASADRQDEIIRFWYLDAIESGFATSSVEAATKQWYGVGLSEEEKKAFDEDIKARFSKDVEQLASGELDSWGESAKGVTAACVVGDQFTRNIYRKSGKAFELDAKMQQLVSDALAKGLDKEPPYNDFTIQSCWHLVFMHSEDITHHERALEFYRKAVEQASEDSAKERAISSLAFEEDHYAQIKRFGRYPHRNKALGRESTPEEREYLTTANTYGQ